MQVKSQEHANNQIEAIPSDDALVISRLRQDIINGKHWYTALLGAIGSWTGIEENYNGRHFCYLIGGEAFDWLQLAERLCMELEDLVPEDEMTDLLFLAKPPIDIPHEEWERLIGEFKYRAHLNYLYGVTVEEVLSIAVEEEVRKDLQAFASYDEEEIQAIVYKRIYGAEVNALLDCFRNERGYVRQEDTTLAEMKEFTYWLFQYRLERCDKAKVASDTKKALLYIQNQQDIKGLRAAGSNGREVNIIEADTWLSE